VEAPVTADQLEGAGILCYPNNDTSVRLVTSWQTTPDDVAAAGAAFREAVKTAR
jgi:threonine aldolase